MACGTLARATFRSATVLLHSKVTRPVAVKQSGRIHGIDHQQHHIWDVPVELCQLYVIICAPGKTILFQVFHIYVYPRVTMHNQKQISGPGRSLTHTPSLLVTSAYPWLYKHAQRWPKGHLQAESLGRSCMECLHCFHALMGFVSACLGGQQAAMPYFVFFFVALCHANQGLDRIKNKGMILPCSHVLYPNTNEQTKPTDKTTAGQILNKCDKVQRGPLKL